VSAGGRANARARLVRRTALIAGALVLLTLVFAFSGHWILAIVFGIPAVAAGWVFAQARGVR
jgi:hypothetical protein